MQTAPFPRAFTEFPTHRFDAEVMDPAANSGDVCNRYGDLRGVDVGGCRAIIKSGIVYVTQEQARLAAPFGWTIEGEWPDDAELVQVKRQ